ncbi:unnamed protein product [Urochloa decumbens]|uniref:LOB domain-containing protein n=1 Tax=Urochloa decumbens TaxID=240449 RepID=A0ABC9F201_9POAL
MPLPEDEAEAAAAAQQTPCAGCRTLRRRCVPGCVFAPYFPADGGDDPSRFAAVHRVFGASNAARMLTDVAPPEDRRRAAETLVEEARARLRDPALGCLSYVAILQMLNERAREQVAAVRAEIAAEFGDVAAAQPVDVAAAPPEVRAEAKEQAGRALAHASEQDAKLLAARRAADLEWWQQHRYAAKRASEGTGGRWKKNRDTNEQVPAETENTAAAGESSIEQTAEKQESLGGNEHPRRETAETQDPAPAGKAAREEVLAASEQIPVAAATPAPPHHVSAEKQLAGEGTSFLDGDQLAASEALAKRMDTIIRWRAAAAGQQCHGDPAAARYASMGLDVTPDAQEEEEAAAAAAEAAASNQDLMVMMLAQQLAEAGAVEQGMAMQLLAAGAAQYGNLAAQYDDDAKLDDVTLVHGHQDMRQQMTVAAAAAAGEIAEEQGMAVCRAAAAELAAGQEMMQLAQAQYAQTEHDVTLGQAIVQQMVQAQQLAGAAKVAGEQGIMPHAATAEFAGEQDKDMALLLQVAAALQNPVAQYSETGLDTSLGQGQGHPYGYRPAVEEFAGEQGMIMQQLANAVGVAGEPNAATTTTQQVAAAYKDGEQGSGHGAAAAFQPPELAKAVGFRIEQQTPPQVETGRALGLQMDSSLLPPSLPSLGQPHAQVAQQQSTDGGDEGQSSDLTAYVYY